MDKVASCYLCKVVHIVSEEKKHCPDCGYLLVPDLDNKEQSVTVRN